MTAYLTDAKAKLGDAAVSNRSYPYYYRVLNTTVEEWKEPEGTTVASGNLAFTTKLVNTHNINALPDSLAAQLKQIIDRKLWEYNLNKGIVTPKP